MKFIDLKTQYLYLERQIQTRINDVLSHGQFIMGPEVDELEQQLSDFVGVKHCITCANGTDALTLALMAIGVKKGDAVFCPTFTFFATAEAIAFLGATPVFVDSEVDTFNISPTHLQEQVELTIKQGRLNPTAVISVDLFGLPANYKDISAISSKHDLVLIEDGAQGFGGEVFHRKAGSFGDIATTSFFPAKPLGCYGDGGALFTDSDEYSSILKSLRVHGKGVDKYDNVCIGMNSRLDTIQAAILLEKLKAFPDELNARRAVAQFYNANLPDTLGKPFVPEGYESAWAQYTIKSNKRSFIQQELSKQGVPTNIYYSKCLHKQTAFKYLSADNQEIFQADKLTEQVFSLPMHPYLSDCNLSKIVNLLNEIT